MKASATTAAAGGGTGGTFMYITRFKWDVSFEIKISAESALGSDVFFI
jgi:hypothetical protein